MRTSILVLLLCISVAAHTQINRSANQLAQESSKTWLLAKVFKGSQYEAVSFGDLKKYDDHRSKACWTIIHHFTITDDKQKGFGEDQTLKKSYQFQFYLDKKMNVVKAESYSPGK